MGSIRGPKSHRDHRADRTGGGQEFQVDPSVLRLGFGVRIRSRLRSQRLTSSVSAERRRMFAWRSNCKEGVTLREAYSGSERYPLGSISPASAPVGVPIGIKLLSPDWSGPTLIRLAYAFEQATRIRRPPTSTLPLS